MTKPRVCIGISLTDKDRDIIEWINMLVEDEQSPRQWIQTLVYAYWHKIPLDIGAVYVPPRKKKTMFFADDEEKPDTPKYSCRKKGKYNEYIVGSVLMISFRSCFEAEIIQLIEMLNEKNKPYSPFIKTIIRQHLKILKEGPNIAPEPLQIIRIMDQINYNLFIEGPSIQECKTGPSEGKVEEQNQIKQEVEQREESKESESKPVEKANKKQQPNPLLKNLRTSKERSSGQKTSG